VWEADDESGIELDDAIEDLESPEQQNITAPPNGPKLIQPTQKLKNLADTVIMRVNAKEISRNEWNKKK